MWDEIADYDCDAAFSQKWVVRNSQKLEGKERKDFKNQNVIASQNEN